MPADRSPTSEDSREAGGDPGGHDPGAEGRHDQTSAQDTAAAGPALSIAGAARGLGVATATLRSWERRYGLGPSLHTPGGHRRYGSEDLARLQVMHRLVRAGVPAAEAARVAVSAPASNRPDGSEPFAALLAGEGSRGTTGSPASPQAGSEGVGASVIARLDDEDVEQQGDRSGIPGGGRVLALPRGADPAARGLARAAIALDAASCERILDVALAGHGTLDTWERLIRPVLGAIGDRWEVTQAGVDVEHTFSAVVAAALARQAVPQAQPRNDRPVLLASVPDELHDLPLRALQATLAEQAIRTHLLGARTPDEALADAVRRLGPPVVVLWAQMGTSPPPPLPVIRPAPVVIVAGPGLADGATGRARARSLADAVLQVRAALGL